MHIFGGLSSFRSTKWRESRGSQTSTTFHDFRDLSSTICFDFLGELE